jgi:glycosyltransferase involved in cell wall biosynthesis
MPQISVILPVYNAEKFLSIAIDSILTQTYTDFELLIINDGSTDSSTGIILSYNDPRIRYINNERNLGLITTLNKGISLAEGKYIARMDADDISFPERFERQYRFMEQNPAVGVVGTYASYIGGNREGQVWKFPLTSEEIKCRLLWGSGVIHPTAFIRRQFLNDYKLCYDTAYKSVEDYKLWYDCINCFEVANIPEVLLQYREHDSQVTRTADEMMKSNTAKMIVLQFNSLNIPISQIDTEIIKQFITYNYNFTLPELNQLISLYVRFKQENKSKKKYISELLNPQIDERLFEACYFSTKKCGTSAITIYRNSEIAYGYSLLKWSKFYIKGLFKL